MAKKKKDEAELPAEEMKAEVEPKSEPQADPMPKAEYDLKSHSKYSKFKKGNN
jgi:hypothetical protein